MTLKALFALAASAALSLSLVACGGTVQTGDGTEETEPDANDPEEPEPGTDPSGGGGRSGSSGANEVDLPECKLGVKVAEADSCVFLYEGRCYEEKLDACGCACKQLRGTVCSSGFPNPDRPTEVTCF